MINIPGIVKTKCGKYGAKLSPGYDFCLSCGTKFSEIPPKIKKRKEIRMGWVSTIWLILSLIGEFSGFMLGLSSENILVCILYALIGFIAPTVIVVVLYLLYVLDIF
ncbi:MAG: hypothetical protein P8Y23_08815 [Candidatus Lokiarchaeota archaeon]